jgi:hypothetical protein
LIILYEYKQKEDPAVQVFFYYKERYNFLEAKKYYVLAAPPRKDMETRKYKKTTNKIYTFKYIISI